MDDPYIAIELKDLFKRLKEHRMASLFTQPIEEIISVFPLYTQIVKNPTDMIKIEQKINDDHYTYNLLEIEDFKTDMDVMLNNCKSFNTDKKHWVYKQCVAFEDYFGKEWKKFILKIQKHQTTPAVNKPNLNKRQSSNEININNNNTNINANSSISSSMNNINQNIQVISNPDDEKIHKRIKTLFMKISANLNISDQNRDEIIAMIVKSISKRNKSFDQIYDDTMKFLTKNLNNENMKSYFSKKFRKLLRNIKEEQNDGVINKSNENKAFNIKIHLNENEEKREEKGKLEYIKKDVINFIDNQKIPEVFRNITEYPIEPSLRKKISVYAIDIRNSFLTHY